jgi:hypothetical protein
MIQSISYSEIEYNKWQVVYELDIQFMGGGTSCYYHGIDSKNNKDIIAVANINAEAPHIIKSQDSGKTWKIVLAEKLDGIYDGNYYKPFRSNVLCVASNDLAIIGCDSGSYWRSTDNGETW